MLYLKPKLRVAFSILVFISFISAFECKAVNYSRLIGRTVVMPSNCPDTTDYVFVHIVRGQECTKCAVSALHQWNNIITLIRRNDISYYCIVEALPDDTPETIQTALLSKPLLQRVYIDYENEFLLRNSWLNNRRFRDINDFLIDNSGKVISVGNPLENLLFLKQLRSSLNFSSKFCIHKSAEGELNYIVSPVPKKLGA